MKHYVLRLSGLLSLALTVNAAPDGAARKFPLFDGLGPHTRTVTTNSPEAQRYFDQGLNYLYGFHHRAAIRSFEEAVKLDPECASAHWGIALANGPHINFPAMLPPMIETAWKELELARQYAADASPVEQDLITALAARYANPQPEDRSKLDLAYADAMREVWKKHPDDPDVGALFAESMMDLRPWNQWSSDGIAEPGTEEIIATLDKVIELQSDHPFANHLYIHAVEASPNPERAVAAADRLRDLQPGIAHNVHMPTHIDIRVGLWHQAIESNQKAVKADGQYRAAMGQPRDFVVVYAAHNGHMLGYAAMMTGQSELAIESMRSMVASIPPEFMEEWALNIEGFAAMPLEVLARFGRWDEILAEPDHYPDHMPFNKAFRHAMRAIAYAAKDDPKSARKEQATYRALARKVPAEATFGNNPITSILAVVTPMVEGEILVREGKMDAAITALRMAVKAEDLLKYDEPPGWILPVRHSLGATLMTAQRYAEAEQVYRDDLARLPNNGWSLFGLSESLLMQDKTDESNKHFAHFKEIWKEADVVIESSCFCQAGVASKRA